MAAPTATRRFFATLGGVALAALLICFGLTALADPLGLVARAFPGMPHLCAPGLAVVDRATAPYQLPLSGAHEILLGDSRVQYGFAPADADALLDGPALNLAMPAASLHEMRALVRQGRAAAPLRRVWIGLGFPDLAGQRRPPLEAPTATAGPALFALRYGIIDPPAIRRALKTLPRSGCEAPAFTPRGFAAAFPPGADRRRFAFMREVYRARLERARELPASVYREWLADLDGLLGEADAGGIAVILFVPPYHPSVAADLRATGMTGRLRRWQADVAAVAERHPRARFLSFTAAAEAGRLPSGCLDRGADGCAFLDPVHFDPHVGRAILEAGLRAAAGRGPSTAP